MTNSASLHNALVAWFVANREDLPWRHNRSPYTVWLSEVMLQQTQVKTVIPYYERFLARFPDIGTLARAPLDDVLKAWEGLGYYSRARHLHRAAQVIVDELDGQFPSTMASLLNLPGIGRYTAGAIASLAFEQDAPVLDGNLMRVLTRLYNIVDDVTLQQTKRSLWDLAAEVLPSGRAGLWNEGLMDLGRRICTPKSPRCDVCPLTQHCQSRQIGAQEYRPVRSRKAATPHYDVTAAVIHQADGHILIARRPIGGMLGGLWEFPGGKQQPDETLPECLRREIREELGIEVDVGQQIASIKHAYTHFRITLHAYICTHISGTPQSIECADWAWVTLDDLDNYAFPVTDRKIIAILRNPQITTSD
ncbi:MAG: A/G-specific adenine glycosylase [Anaerolineae bacterium]|nr:A/G-specific adenine glycosylase [Anaerolineae bacterium]